MASGAPAWVITVNVTVNASTPGGTDVNTATVSAFAERPRPREQQVNNNKTVRNTAHLAVTKTEASHGELGASTTYTITLTNTGLTARRGSSSRTRSPSTPWGAKQSGTARSRPGSSDARRRPARRGRGEHLSTHADPVGRVRHRHAGEHRLDHDDPGHVRRSGGGEQHGHHTDTVPQANLSITKTDSTDPENPGASFNYVLR